MRLTVAMSGANTRDIHALRPLMHAIPPVHSRRGLSTKLHANKGYDDDDLRHWLLNQKIMPRGRIFCRLLDYRRLGVPSTHGANRAGFFTKAAAMACYKNIPK